MKMRLRYKRKTDKAILMSMTVEYGSMILICLSIIFLIALWPEIMFCILASLIGLTVFFYLFIQPSIRMLYADYKSRLREKIIKSKSKP